MKSPLSTLSKTRRAIGCCLVGASLLTYILTLWCYAKQPDSLAAFTVFPIWMWGSIGLIISVFAFFLLRAPLSLIVTAVWAVTLLFTMDEAKSLSNFNHPHIKPERASSKKGSRIIRVATVNCAGFAYGNPIEDLKKWDPDIIILQQAHPYWVGHLANAFYQGKGDFQAHLGNGIITRFKIQRHISTPQLENQQVTIELPNGENIEVVNVHLATAATDLRLWSKKSRKLHHTNRDLRRMELSQTLKILNQTTSFPNTPIIFGGDFNSGATDIVHRQLTPDFDDVFSKVGRGWGDTFHRRFPILRIDHIYATRRFQPLSCGVLVSKKTDHRMVIADLILPE